MYSELDDDITSLTILELPEEYEQDELYELQYQLWRRRGRRLSTVSTVSYLARNRLKSKFAVEDRPDVKLLKTLNRLVLEWHNLLTYLLTPAQTSPTWLAYALTVKS